MLDVFKEYLQFTTQQNQSRRNSTKRAQSAACVISPKCFQMAPFQTPQSFLLFPLSCFACFPVLSLSCLSCPLILRPKSRISAQAQEGGISVLILLTQAPEFSSQHLKNIMHPPKDTKAWKVSWLNGKRQMVYPGSPERKSAQRTNVFAHHKTSQGFHLIYKSDGSREIEVCTSVVNKILQIKMYQERKSFLKG